MRRYEGPVIEQTTITGQLILRRIMIPHPSTIACEWPFGCRRQAHGYDHDHNTDIVRFALCQHHNSILGQIGDLPATLRALADWLECADKGFTYHQYRSGRDRLRDHDSHNEQRRVRYAADPTINERRQEQRRARK